MYSFYFILLIMHLNAATVVRNVSRGILARCKQSRGLRKELARMQPAT